MPQDLSKEKKLSGNEIGFYYPRNLFARFTESLQNPGLIGADAGIEQYLKVQWCVRLWRYLSALQIPVVILVSPAPLTSVRYSWFLYAAITAYTVLYGYLCRQDLFAGKFWFHLMDQSVCAAFLLASRDAFTVNAIAIYAMSSLIARPSVRFWSHMPGVVVLGAAYILASISSSDGEVSISQAVGLQIVFFLMAVSFWIFSKIINEVSVLELDKRLNEQRKYYQGRLHDELGNIICGLHYKIQSLKFAGGDITDSEIDFLASANEQSVSVLDQLIRGLNEGEMQVRDALTEFVDVFAGNDLKVLISTPDDMPDLDPGTSRHVITIVYEALSNALKHSGSNEAQVRATWKDEVLRFAIEDDGNGFRPDKVAWKEGSCFGLKSMKERAQLIHGTLQIKTRHASGTKVELTLDLKQKHDSRGKSYFRWFVGNETTPTGCLFQFLMKTKVLVAMLSCFRWISLSPEQRYNPAALVIIATIVLNAAGWYLFRNRLAKYLETRTWPLVMEQVYFGLIFYLGWSQGLEAFYDDVPTCAVVVSAYFLTISNNLKLALFQASMLFLAFSLTSGIAGTSMVQDLVWNIGANIVFALAAGLLADFVRSLEYLQADAINRSLQNQRERLSAVTHEQLWEMLHKMGREIKDLSLAFNQQKSIRSALEAMENRSNETKVRLRNILNYLEDYQVDEA